MLSFVELFNVSQESINVIKLKEQFLNHFRIFSNNFDCLRSINIYKIFDKGQYGKFDNPRKTLISQIKRLALLVSFSR